jgi:hypothetical protein
MNDAMANNREQVKETTSNYQKLIGVLNNLTSQSFKQGDFKITGTTAPKAAKKESIDVDTKGLDLLKKQQEYYKDDIYEYARYGDLIITEQTRIAKLKVKGKKDENDQIAEIDKIAEQDRLQNQKNLGMAIMKIADQNTKEFEKQEKEAAKKDLDAKKKAAQEAIDIIQDQMDVEEKMAGKDFEKKKLAVKKAMTEIKVLIQTSSNPEVIEDLGKAYDKLGKKLKLLDIEKQQQDAEKLKTNWENFAKTAASTVTDGLMVMYDAMQKGENPLKALGDFVADLTKKFIAAIVQATIFKGLMALLGTVTGGGGGLLGGLVGGVGKILGFAEGGIVSRPTMAMVGEGGQSEAIMPLNKLGNMMNSTFNAGAMSGGGGGGGGQFTLKGNDLVLALQRSNYSLNLRRGS